MWEEWENRHAPWVRPHTRNWSCIWINSAVQVLPQSVPNCSQIARSHEHSRSPQMHAWWSRLCSNLSKKRVRFKLCSNTKARRKQSSVTRPWSWLNKYQLESSYFKTWRARGHLDWKQTMDQFLVSVFPLRIMNTAINQPHDTIWWFTHRLLVLDRMRFPFRVHFTICSHHSYKDIPLCNIM